MKSALKYEIIEVEKDTMKNIMKLFIVLSLVFMIATAVGCTRGEKASLRTSDAIPTTKQIDTTAKPTEVQTENTTEQPTEKPTEVPTGKTAEPSTKAQKQHEYTVEELLLKSVPEILEIMENDITVEVTGYGGNSTGSICFYNYDKVPGFLFSPKSIIYNPDKTDLDDVKKNILLGDYENLSFVTAIKSGKVNDLFSADMTYNEIADITGIYSTQPPAGQGLIRQDLTAFCNNCSHVAVTYETSSEAMKHLDSKTGYDPEYLKQENPKVDNITAYPIT